MKELDEAFELLHREDREAPASLADARAKLMAAADNDSKATSRRKWLIPTAAAAAVGLIATAVGLQVVTSGEPVGTPQVRTVSASEVLNQAADLSAVTGTDKPFGPHQYRYIVEDTWVTRSSTGPKPDTGFTYLVHQRIERWIPFDQKDIWQETRTLLGTPEFLGGSDPNLIKNPPPVAPEDQGQWRGACGDFFPNAKPKKVCGDPFDWDDPVFYLKLPRDPDQLYTVLQNLTKKRGTSPGTMFHYGIQVLGAGLMPADLRGPWYRAMAKIPGIKVIDEQSNLDGKTGIALGFDDEHEQRQLIIDPHTGAFIGERTVAGPRPYNSWIKPGTETGTSSITTSVVNGLGQQK